VTWESGTNLLGDDGRFWLDTNNCVNAVYETDPCKTEWKLFNLDGSGEKWLFEACSSRFMVETKPARLHPVLTKKQVGLLVCETAENFGQVDADLIGRPLSLQYQICSEPLIDITGIDMSALQVSVAYFLHQKQR